MADTIKHRYNNPTADDGDPNKTGPDEWNDSHPVSGGVDGQVFTRDSLKTDGWSWADLPLPRAYLAGLTLANNVGDANNDIDVAVGVARSDDDAANIKLAAPMTKQLDALWVAGTNQGGLDAGGKNPNTWYHVFVIYDPVNRVTDVLFSTSVNAPTMPTGYTKKRRIGAIRTDGTSNIKAFVQTGDRFAWKASVLDVNATNPGNAALLRTLTVPTGVVVKAVMNAGVDDGRRVYISDPSVNDEACGSSAAPLGSVGTDSSTGFVPGLLEVPTNTSAQVRARLDASGTSTHLRIATLGWYDRRGRDD